jgi:hypothetical protein
MKRYPALGAALAAAMLLIGCGATGGSPAPSGTPGSSPTASASPGPSGSPAPSGTPGASVTPIPTPGPTSGSITVTSHAQAAALVLASDDRFAGIGPQQFDMIGQCCWYEVAEAEAGWLVTVHVGSGDCMAGCIDRQSWTYSVDRAGAIALVDEEGAADRPAPIGGPGPASVTIQLVAGPTCPVETDPPDPNCAPRPVVGAEVVVRAPDGSELARGVAGQDGSLPISLPEGTYWLDPQPVEGLMGTASGIAFRVLSGEQAMYTLYYDTGIR